MALVLSRHLVGANKDKVEIPANPFKMREGYAAEDSDQSSVHIIRKGVRCDTESRGRKLPSNRSPREIVLDASEGFIPLWASGTTLRWRFRERSLEAFADPNAAKAAIELLLANAILEWGRAAPIRFAHSEDVWDFEIVLRQADDCDINGCVLASAFFPDAGQHELVIYPKMFEQSDQEQLETLVHEIGHIFGLRHFFALVHETAWPAEVFGEHQEFSIMNYGDASMLTKADRSDLQNLYELAWAGELTHINGTPIKFVKPFHHSAAAGDVAVAAAAAVG